MSPNAVSLSPAPVQFTAAAGTVSFVDVTVTTNGATVIQNPVTIVNDQGGGGVFLIFNDTQSGTCWQQYEALGNKIPSHTSCTIRVSFRPPVAGTFTGTLTVNRCSLWHVDPIFGFIVCDALNGSQTVNLVGTGT
jgi:hypothetical protein